jgi:hypothetical protein
MFLCCSAEMKHFGLRQSLSLKVILYVSDAEAWSLTHRKLNNDDSRYSIGLLREW